MAESNQIELLIRQLDKQRDAYIAAFEKAHEVLAKSLASAAATTTSVESQALISSPRSVRRGSHCSLPAYTQSERFKRQVSTDLATFGSSLNASFASDDNAYDCFEDDDNDQDLYVQEPLAHQLYKHEDFRQHLRSYSKWRSAGETILDGIINCPLRIQQQTLFPTRKGRADDRSHVTHLQVFDVSKDGSLSAVELPEDEKGPSNAITIWNTIRKVNPPGAPRQAVGRITVIREPSPILLGAVHFTHNNIFDVDQLFNMLVKTAASSADFTRAFHEDIRQQRSFVFNFEYFTIVGKDCEPMKWQKSNQPKDPNSHDIPITRCSSVLALSLGGLPIQKIKNHSRHAINSHGYVYDPFASWQVLNIQCFPDSKSNLQVHDPDRRFVNGVEAFLVTLLGEFRDAQVRFSAILRAITKLITPPLDFMFDVNKRDELQFEDEDYTFTRRYFWAYQTLGRMNDSIKAIIDGFEQTFTNDVWEGQHKTIWPMFDKDSPRGQNYLQKMAILRQKFNIEMENFRSLLRKNQERRIEIQGLREELFSGTSIREARNSVENTKVTIQQGYNIKLLTLVSIFFLPLTFVTSIFGMTNMPEEHNYAVFAIVTVTVCVPFFILIGSLNTIKGMEFWVNKTKSAFKAMGSCLYWLARLGRPIDNADISDTETDLDMTPSRRVSMDRAMTLDSASLRLKRWASAQKAEAAVSEGEDDSKPIKPHARRPTHHHNLSTTPTITWMWDEERRKARTAKQEV